jgi:alkylation response protein AidB-like acyl-CoA dehydrogenase
MHGAVQPKTAEGASLVSLAEGFAPEFAERAAKHDAEASYPFENLEQLKESGFLTAAIPTSCGGLGVDSVHDIVLASSRLAHGDPALVIGVNMHFVITMLLTRHLRMAIAGNRERRIAGLTETLSAIVDDGTVFSALVSEAGQDLTHPNATAARDGDGWRVNGTKIFATMSPAATVLNTAVSYRDEDGKEHYGYAQVPSDTPGVTIHDDWDALGMRASGSNSVTFDDARIAADALRDRLPLGAVSDPFLERNLASGPLHASAALGIAEEAERTAVEAIRARKTAPGRRSAAERPYLLMLAAENEIDLAAARATFARAAALIDEYYEAHPIEPGDHEAITTVFTQSQIAKAFVQSAAARVVDRALSLSGGAGYMNKSRLSRMYRDVRATPFMHPLGANVAYEFIGQVTLGVQPTLG